MTMSWISESQENDIVVINTCGFIDNAKEESLFLGLVQPPTMSCDGACLVGELLTMARIL